MFILNLGESNNMTLKTTQGESVRFPYEITLAVSIVDDLSVFKPIPSSYRDILRRLIKKVSSKNGQQAIFAKRETLAFESGCSLPTVYRALDRFEKEGWIERDWQPCAGLRGSESHITLSGVLCQLLLLPSRESNHRQKPLVMEEPPHAKAAEYQYPACEATPLPLPITNDTSPEYQGNNQLLKKDQPDLPSEPVDKNVTTNESPTPKDLPVKSIRFGKFTIPSELAWLISDQELSPTGVLSLMKLAKSVGQRLSDIVSITAKYLRKLRGGRLYAYLATLARSERDWAWIAKESRTESAKIEQDASSAEEASDLISKAKESINGCWFKTLDGLQVFHVGGGMYKNGAQVFEKRGGSWITAGLPTLDSKFMNAIKAMRLIPCEPGTIPQ